MSMGDWIVLLLHNVMNISNDVLLAWMNDTIIDDRACLDCLILFYLFCFWFYYHPSIIINHQSSLWTQQNAAGDGKKDIKTLPVRAYLDETVVPLLLKAMSALVKERYDYEFCSLVVESVFFIGFFLFIFFQCIWLDSHDWFIEWNLRAGWNLIFNPKNWFDCCIFLN